jgi:hypothetical protein
MPFAPTQFPSIIFCISRLTFFRGHHVHEAARLKEQNSGSQLGSKNNSFECDFDPCTASRNTQGTERRRGVLPGVTLRIALRKLRTPLRFMPRSLAQAVALRLS